MRLLSLSLLYLATCVSEHSTDPYTSQAVIDAAVPELPKLRRALIAAREDLILGFGAAPLAAAAGSFATIAGTDFSPGRGADLLLLVQPVQRRGRL